MNDPVKRGGAVVQESETNVSLLEDRYDVTTARLMEPPQDCAAIYRSIRSRMLARYGRARAIPRGSRPLVAGVARSTRASVPCNV